MAAITFFDSSTLSVSAPTITETNADQMVTFTVTSPSAVAGGFDVAISATDGTAGAADYARLRRGLVATTATPHSPHRSGVAMKDEISEDEWNFSEPRVPDEELIVATAYEYARESRTIRACWPLNMTFN